MVRRIHLNDIESEHFIKEVRFKIARTNITKTYLIDIRWTIGHLIHIIKSRVAEDFRLYNIELVESGQDDTEDAPALPLSEYSIIFHNKYTNVSNIAFYVRPRIVVECSICWNAIASPIYYFHCDHTVCRPCFQECYTHDISSCPQCRSRI